MNLALIGYRGTGKSTIARQLALALGWDWVDTDAQIEHRAGKSIQVIFAEDGEQAFRERECQVVAELAERERCVLALGGGAVLRPQTRTVLARRAKAIWLRARPETLWARISADPSTSARRPNLTGGGLAEIEELLSERTPIYQACAELVIDTDDRSPAEIVDEILRSPLLAELRDQAS